MYNTLPWSENKPRVFIVNDARGIRNASYLAINDGRQGQIVEYLSAVSPDSDWTVLAETLIVETVDLGDLSGLVVSSNQRYPVWVAHLRSKTETEMTSDEFPAFPKFLNSFSSRIGVHNNPQDDIRWCLQPPPQAPLPPPSRCRWIQFCPQCLKQKRSR